MYFTVNIFDILLYEYTFNVFNLLIFNIVKMNKIVFSYI